MNAETCRLAPLPQHSVQNGRIIQDVAESPAGSAQSMDSVDLMSGTLDGQPVQVLVYTGSHMSMARADLVDQGKWKEREVELQCVHGDVSS